MRKIYTANANNLAKWLYENEGFDIWANKFKYTVKEKQEMRQHEGFRYYEYDFKYEEKLRKQRLYGVISIYIENNNEVIFKTSICRCSKENKEYIGVEIQKELIYLIVQLINEGLVYYEKEEN